MMDSNDIKPRDIRAKMRGLAVIAASLCLIAPSAAFADDAAQDTPQGTTSQIQTAQIDGLSFNLPTSMSQTDFSASLDITPESIGSTLFKLDIADPNCLSGETSCLRRDDQIDVGLSKAFSSFSDTGLDLSITPRAVMRFDDESTSALLGAKFEIGDDLRTGSGLRSNTWYLFAGADAESISYGPNALGRADSGRFFLQDNILVGDAQAGVGYRAGDTDVSLSYMRREARGDDLSFTEDAAALSFTWKR